MEKSSILQSIKDLGLFAVIRGPSPELTLRMVEALVEGGVRGIEITYSTPNAEDVVAKLKNSFADEILLGMGTLTDPKQANRARDAGAKYLVSPICSSELVQAMIATDLVVMAGALTPTEIFQTYQTGADVVKVFPGSLVGPSYIKAIKNVFPEIPLMPTGGVNIDNIPEWFSAGVVAVGAGSELCPANLAKEGRFDEIRVRASQFIFVIQEIRKSSIN